MATSIGEIDQANTQHTGNQAVGQGIINLLSSDFGERSDSIYRNFSVLLLSYCLAACFCFIYLILGSFHRVQWFSLCLIYRVFSARRQQRNLAVFESSCHLLSIFHVRMGKSCQVPFSTTSKLAGSFYTLSLQCRASSREAVDTNFH